MSIDKMTREEKMRNIITYDGGKYCLYHRDKFGYTFVKSFITKEEMFFDLSRCSIEPNYDSSAVLKMSQT